MTPIAFISHSDKTGNSAAQMIYDKLTSPSLDVQTFLSTNISPGKDFVEEIIENLVQTDILFFVIDSDSPNSPWMKWEYDFCKKRYAKIVHVVYLNANLDDPKLGYLNQQSVRIAYHHYRDDILRDRIYGLITKLDSNTVQRAKTRESIEIDLDLDAMRVNPDNMIVVSGQIHAQNYHSIQNVGRAYLHIPNRNTNVPPNSLDVGPFAIDTDGRFAYKINLPDIQPRIDTQTLYIEVRVGPTARVIPLRRNSQDAAPTNDPTSTDNNVFDEDDVTRIQDNMRRHSNGVLKSTIMDIDGWRSLRPQVENIQSLLEKEDRVVLTGDKGSGKTVILCNLYEMLSDKRRIILVRCDDFLHSDSVDHLDMMLGGNSKISDCLAGMQDGKKTVLLFDSLDAVSRDARSMSLFRQFIQRLWSIDNVQTVCSVRTYDYEYSPAISSVQWGTRVDVDDLPEDSLEDALLHIGNHTVPDELKKILRNPLRLKILQLVASKNPEANFANVKSEIGLYQEHWKEYVDKNSQRNEISTTLLEAARMMITSRTVAVMRQALGGGQDLGGLDAACSSNILEVSGDHARFFHHAYLDYVASQYVLQAHPDIVGFLESDPHNVFFLPTLAFTLSLMRDGGKLQYLKTIASICNSNLQYYWKSAALKSLAELDGFSKGEIDPIGRILSDDTDLQRHFLLAATELANPFWLLAWSDTRIKIWLEKPHNAKIILDYIKSLSGHRDLHDRMIRLVRIIVDNGDLHPLIRQKAVMSTADMLSAPTAGWYVDLSRHPEARVRNGVVSCLEALLDADEDAAATAFANVVAYRETSSAKTQFMSHGSFNMTSNKTQDNSHAIWAACEAFPDLLAKKPAVMMGAAMASLDSINRGRLDGDKIVEDHRTLLGFPDSSPHSKMIKSINGALPGLIAVDAPKYASLLASSRLASFHHILLAALVERPEQHKDLIYDELLSPSLLLLPSIRGPARDAIRLVSPLLSQTKIEKLIAVVMELGATGGDDSNRHRPERADRLKSYYLSAFDRSVLPAVCAELVDRYPQPPPSSRDPPSKAVTAPWPPVPTAETERGTPVTAEQAVALLLEDGGAERADALTLLEQAVDRAGDASAGLDDALAAQMRALFLGLTTHPDPRRDEPDGGPGEMITVEPTVRGLAARGLIRLCALAQDRSLLPAIESMSKDRVNTVRGSVAEDLGLLYGADAALARRIAVRYSADADRRVLFYMPNVLFMLARNHPDDALLAIQNILSRRESTAAMTEYVSQALLFLALGKGHAGAWDVLQGVIEDASLPVEIRRCIPFILKEGYLFNPPTQDQAIEILSKLLDSEEKSVRAAASFFLLVSVGDGGADGLPALIDKIRPLLDKIALETDAVPYNPEIIETLVRFLKDYWHLLPELALDLLEKVSRMPYASYNPVLMDETVAALNGLFRTLAGDDDQHRCLSVLDSYVKAGWPRAMALLREIGRPD